MCQESSQGLPALHLHTWAGSASHCSAEGSLPHRPPHKVPAVSGNHESCPRPHSPGVVGNKMFPGYEGGSRGTESGKDFSPPAHGVGPAGSGTFFVGLVPLQPLKVAMDGARPVPVLGLVWEGRPGLITDLTPSCHQLLLQVAKVALKMGWNLGKSLCRG